MITEKAQIEQGAERATWGERNPWFVTAISTERLLPPVSFGGLGCWIRDMVLDSRDYQISAMHPPTLY